jgi:hypothetical protein
MGFEKLLAGACDPPHFTGFFVVASLLLVAGGSLEFRGVSDGESRHLARELDQFG